MPSTAQYRAEDPSFPSHLPTMTYTLLLRHASVTSTLVLVRLNPRQPNGHCIRLSRLALHASGVGHRQPPPRHKALHVGKLVVAPLNSDPPTEPTRARAWLVPPTDGVSRANCQRLGRMLCMLHTAQERRSRDVGVLNAAVVADSEAGLVMVCVVVCSQVRMRRMECCTQIVNV